MGSPGAVVDIPGEFAQDMSKGLDAYPPPGSVAVPAQDRAGWTWQAGTGSATPPPGEALIDAGQVTLPVPAISSGGFEIDWRIVWLVAAMVVAVVAGRYAALRVRRSRSSSG